MTGSEYKQMIAKNESYGRRMLFDEYYNYVYTIVYKLLGECLRRDVEECVSDIFAEIFFTLENSNCDDRQLKGFIATIAKRRAIDKYRSLSKIKIIAVDDEDFDKVISAGSPEMELEESETKSIIFDEIKNLGEPDSTIIIQKFYYNKTSKEIAELLSMKTSAVRMRCSRALKKLKKTLLQKGLM